MLFIPWHFPLQNDTSITGCSQKAEELFRKEYPAVYEHLLKFKDKLSKRNQAETGVRYEWYALQRWGANYSDDFNKPKIIFSRISGNEPCFAYDHAGMMTNDTGYIISGPNIDYLLEKLCSDVYWFAFKVFYMGGGIDKEFKVANLNNLPIPLPGTPEIKFSREELDFILKSLQ